MSYVELRGMWEFVYAYVCVCACFYLFRLLSSTGSSVEIARHHGIRAENQEMLNI